MSNPQTFQAVVLLNGKTATGIEVPAEVVDGLGAGRKPAVKVSIGGYSYRSSVAAMGGKFMLPLSAEHRAGAGVTAGDTVTVTLEVDTEPRTVAVPEDFQSALAKDAGAKQFFDSLAYSHKLRHVLAIEGAKTAETRQRRIQKALEMLREGKK
ncbi:MAG: YdeI/OmpD-associated family protein [Dehalococcoidia bacterium]